MILYCSIEGCSERSWHWANETSDQWSQTCIQVCNCTTHWRSECRSKISFFCCCFTYKHSIYIIRNKTFIFLETRSPNVTTAQNASLSVATHQQQQQQQKRNYFTFYFYYFFNWLCFCLTIAASKLHIDVTDEDEDEDNDQIDDEQQQHESTKQATKIDEVSKSNEILKYIRINKITKWFVVGKCRSWSSSNKASECFCIAIRWCTFERDWRRISRRCCWRWCAFRSWSTSWTSSPSLVSYLFSYKLLNFFRF